MLEEYTNDEFKAMHQQRISILIGQRIISVIFVDLECLENENKGHPSLNSSATRGKQSAKKQNPKNLEKPEQNQINRYFKVRANRLKKKYGHK